uniref:Uncharacterized protein n=1 Tax=Rhizophora mucronata TaxID=61149 RepID=A0A2P2PU70_RHIMU
MLVFYPKIFLLNSHQNLLYTCGCTNDYLYPSNGFRN